MTGRLPALAPAAPLGPTGGRSAAFFDLDGTLIRGSINIPLARAAFAAGLVRKRDLARDLLGNAVFMLVGASDDRAAGVRERILRDVAGHPATHVEALADDFLHDAVASMDGVMVERIRRHQAAGHATVVVSASPVEIVERFAAAAGMTAGLGTRAARDGDGCYTGALDGPFCYAEGKVPAVRAFADERGYDLASCFAYSDSVSDLPMMELVGQRVAVNPDAKLRRLAADRGWSLLTTRRSLRLDPTVPLRRAVGRLRSALGRG